TPLAGTSISYANTGLAQNAQYYYQVQGVRASGNTWYSAVAASTTPSAPTSLSSTAPSGYEADLTWTSNSGWGPTFAIERSTSGGLFTQIDSTGATSYHDTTAAPSTAYAYRVRAVGPGGNSQYSSTSSITTPAAPPIKLLALLQ